MTEKIGELLVNFITAKNRRDVSGVLSFYAEDISGKLAGIWQRDGKKSMQGITEWEAAMNPTYKVSHTMILKGRVRCRLTESNEWLRRMGVESIVYEPFLITVDDGQITAINAEFAIDSFKKYQHAWTAVAEWIEEKHPEQFAVLFDRRGFEYNGATARQWLDLTKKYEETRQ